VSPAEKLNIPVTPENGGAAASSPLLVRLSWQGNSKVRQTSQAHANAVSETMPNGTCG